MIFRTHKGFADFVDVLQPIVMAFGIFIMVYVFLAQPHKVDGKSMQPNFQDQEFILTDKVTYRNMDPKRGDVIIFHAPPPFDSDFIKRVIGLPNEKVMIKDGIVYINQQILRENYLPKEFKTNERAFLKEGVEYLVPDNYFFVMGDNREGSSDSREWGPINKNSIVGRAFFRYWPPGKIGIINHQVDGQFFDN